MTELKRIMELQIPVLIELRQDLNLTSDLEELRNQMQMQFDKISRKLDSVLVGLESTSLSPSPAHVDQPSVVSGG